MSTQYKHTNKNDSVGYGKHFGLGQLLLAWLLTGLISSLAYAVPMTATYQGSLENAEGEPLNATVNMTFALYDTAQGGNALWTESHPQVEVTDGLFSVILGTTVPFDENSLTDERYLGVTVESDPEMTPRQELTSAFFAMRAAVAESVKTAAVNTETIADGAVTAEKIAPQTITGDKIADLSGHSVTELDDVSDAGSGQIITDAERQKLEGLTITNSTFQLNGNHAYYTDGNVGIGTMNPEAKLDVQGDIQLGPQGTATGWSNTQPSYSMILNASSWDFDQTAALSKFFLQAGGLDCDGGECFGLNPDWGPRTFRIMSDYVCCNAPDGTTTETLFEIRDDYGLGNHYAIFHGNVGIGTASPSKLLDVAGNARIGKTNSWHYLEIASQHWPEIRWTTPTYSSDMRIGMAHEDNPHYGVLNGDWYVHSPATDRMDIIMRRKGGVSLAGKGGNVGIGTMNPSQLLDVAGNARIGKTNSWHYLEIASQHWPEIRWTTPTYRSDMRIGMAHEDNPHYGVLNGDWYVYSPATDRMDIIMHRKGGVSLAGKGGNVGIGTMNPIRTLHLQSPAISSEIVLEVSNYAANKRKWNIVVDGETSHNANEQSKMYFRQLNDAGSGGTVPLVMYSNGNVLMTGNVGVGRTAQYKLDVAGTIRGNNVSPSDQRLKQNIQPLENSLAKVEQLRGVSFEWKDKEKETGTQVGLIAQEVETVLPELVSTDNEGYKSLAYDKMTAVLIEAIKELKAQNDALKAIVCKDHPEPAICQ